MVRRITFLESTKQTGKFIAAVGLFVATGAALGWLLLYAELSDYVVVLIPVLSIGALAVGLWLCLAVRCPRCKARLVWIAAREYPIGGWLSWLLELTSCPRCGFDPLRGEDGEEQGHVDSHVKRSVVPSSESESNRQSYLSIGFA
jgi:hypothetical protein